VPARLDLAAEALGLPEDLLVLGWHLFEGYPDCDEAVAEEIALKMDFLGQIPVGVDATQVAARFVAGCLLDRFGVLAAPSGLRTGRSSQRWGMRSSRGRWPRWRRSARRPTRGWRRWGLS
jgi:hypothetical protein